MTSNCNNLRLVAALLIWTQDGGSKRSAHLLKNKSTAELFPPIIMLAMEDVTTIMSIANTLVSHTSEMKKMLSGRTHKLEEQIKKLESQMNKLKKK